VDGCGTHCAVLEKSAEAVDADVKGRLMAGGATDYLSKPIDLDVLPKTITRTLQPSSAH
jgi:CheY-like chemotaxis protein